MNKQRIKPFLDDLFENVLSNATIDRFLDFYTEDVIGHQSNQKFYLDNIKHRTKILKRYFLSIVFKIENFLVLNKFIVIVVRQQCIKKKDKKFYEAILMIVCRMRDNKICEIWILSSHRLYPANHQAPNIDFKPNWKSVVDDKSKENLVSKLSTTDLSYMNPKIPFSAMEKKCFYFYVNGLTAKQIAKILNLSYRTVESYIANIKVKINCRTKNEMQNKFFQTS